MPRSHRHCHHWLLLPLLLFSGSGSAAELVLGLFAYRPTAIVQQRYQPLADYLSTQLPDTTIRLQVLNLTALEAAVANQQVDLILTNPSHYIALRHHFPIGGVLATLVRRADDGTLSDRLGGVIVARNHNYQPDLTALRGQRIAIPGSHFFGGYQTQLYALQQAGLPLPDASQLLPVGNHDAVIAALLEGRAGFGFVRSGIIEQLIRNGDLAPDQLRLVNPQQHAGFPYLSSTQLYPEWPVVALPQVEPSIRHRLAAALLALPSDHPAATSAGIGRFDPAADYNPVEQLSRSLKLPPFDRPPTLEEIWYAYRNIIVLMLGAAVLILLLTLRLLSLYRRLRRTITDNMAQRDRISSSEQALRQSEERFELAIAGSRDGIWDWNMVTNDIYLSPRWKAMLGYADHELSNSYSSFETLLHSDDKALVMESLDRYLAGDSSSFEVEFRMRHRDQGWRWILGRGAALRDRQGRPYRMSGSHTDITARKQSEERLRLAASVFTHAREGIIITDDNTRVIDVNDAFIRITGYSRDAIIGQKPTLLKSGRHDRDFYHTMWQALRSDGYWSGEVWNRRRDGELYVELLTISAIHDSHGKPYRYVALFSDITQLKAQQDELERAAHYDRLTALPNRVLLADRLRQAMAQARRHAVPLMVIYLDIDSFKNINDRYGHSVGDHYLITIARRLRTALREGDTLARIGGDEFVIVALELVEFEHATILLERLLAAASGTIEVNGHALPSSASLGATFYPQPEEVAADQLMRQADQAMYQSKLAGRNRYTLFDTEQDRNARGYHEQIDQIAQALQQQQLVLYYQPKVNMRSGEVVGAEALIRWQHPERGLLPPGLFLPLIEGHLLAIDIGEWVIEQALHQLQQWQRMGLYLAVSVNIDGLHLQQANFVERLRDRLDHYPDVSPRCLVLEVLETSALQDIDHVAELIRQCRQLGIQVALDDFGTGYASLSYLKALPVAQLKIDQGFVRGMHADPDDLAILEGVLALSRAFRCEAVAEGVESEAHGIMLLRLGCELAQGYHIAKPMPAENLPDWIRHWQPPVAWQDLTPLSRHNLPLLYAGVEHSAWIVAIADYLNGYRDEPPILNDYQCRFGGWLHHYASQQFTDEPQFQTLGLLHREIHLLARELIQRHESGELADIEVALQPLRRLRDLLLRQLYRLVAMLD